LQRAVSELFGCWDESALQIEATATPSPEPLALPPAPSVFVRRRSTLLVTAVVLMVVGLSTVIAVTGSFTKNETATAASLPQSSSQPAPVAAIPSELPARKSAPEMAAKPNRVVNERKEEKRSKPEPAASEPAPEPEPPGSDRYELTQFHFHVPSEHRFDGRNAPMEVHFVHRGSNGKLLVVGVMIQVSGKNEPLAPVFTKPPRTTSMRRQVPIDLPKIPPVAHAYFAYQGSLTTPPCSEGVNWVLLKNSISISSNQYKVFKSMFGNNARPPQPLNGREVAVTE